MSKQIRSSVDETNIPEHVELAHTQALGTIVEDQVKPSHGRTLIPRPTNDPNDPFNWSGWEKYSTYLTVCVFTFLATINASNFTVAIKPISAEFKVSTTTAGFLVCFNVLFLGAGNLFWVPLMRVIGKRPMYLIALTMLIAMNIWSAVAHSFNSLLVARILSGFAASAGDATVPSLVSEIFFVHQRGHCMMIFHLALSAGFFLGPLIEAWIAQEVNWRWTCGFIAIAGAGTLIVGIFTIRETSYPQGRHDYEKPAEAFPSKKSLVAELSVLSGYNKNASFVGTFIKTVTMITYPPVAWAGLTIGAFVGWNIVVQLTSSRTFTAKPYSWHTGDLGLLSIAGFVGAALAFFVGGKLIDVIANRMTRLNGGRREPEYRLPAIIIPAIIGPMGILIFGICVAHKTSWGPIAVGYAMQGFGLTAVSNVAVTYAVDGYQPLAGEALVIIFVIRNAIGTILALFATNWQAATGIENAFGEMVGIQYACLLFALLFFFRGKAIRAWTGGFGPMKHLEVEI